MGVVTKTFFPKDMFFNNGIVNLYQFLKKHENQFVCETVLTENRLDISFDEEQVDQIYFDILGAFFKEYKIVHQTDNYRWYFDEKRMNFVLDKRFDVIGKSSGNDILSGVYHYKTCKELGVDKEEIQTKYLNFCKKYHQQPDLKSNVKISDIERELGLKKGMDKSIRVEKIINYLNEHRKLLNVPNGNNQVVLAITLDEGAKKFTNYFVKDKLLKIDSKIHTFEDGQGTFHEMLKQPKNYKIDRWDAMIYWFGGRVQRLYNYDYFIYPNSINLIALEKFKRFLDINDDNVVILDSKSGKPKKIGTNIKFVIHIDSIPAAATIAIV